MQQTIGDMMHLKPNTTGLDCNIKDIQSNIYPPIHDKWGDVEVFGRVYKNPKNDSGFVPEVFENGAYKEVYLDSKKLGHVFFIDSDQHDQIDEGLFSTQLKTVFILNLEMISNSFGEERRDDLLQQQAYQILDEYTFGYDITNLQKTLPVVFSGFDIKSIGFDDMHPFHVFAYSGNINYKLSKTC